MIDPEELLADTPEWTHRRADDRLPPVVTPEMVRTQRAKLMLLVVLVIALVTLIYVNFLQEPAPVGVHVKATQAKEIAKVPTEQINATVTVYQPQAKKKLKLPAAVQQDRGKHVIAATKTKADERPHTVTTVLDSGSGEVTTYDRAEPLPWVAVNRKSELGLYYGLKDGQQAIRIEGRHELMQVKSLHLGATASADVMRNDVDGFIGVGVWARW